MNVKTIALSILFLLLVPVQGFSDVRLDVLRNIQLEEAPLDTAVSEDGKSIYVLYRGEIKIYSIADGRLSGSVPVDESVDHIAGTTGDNLLLLSSTNQNMVRVVRLDFIMIFSTEGSPFKGPADAPVTITVFSDFQ